ncbi:hypothetical protein BDR07DRAFT_1492206 [Suillus spraguei]|nr:hypothetical protein BDR07DRAFT_1492206 [Suillus spraguei]
MSAIMYLLGLFQDEGAIIFVEHHGRGMPLFHVVPCTDIKASGTISRRDPTCNVLVVTDALYDALEQLSWTVRALAYDIMVDTVFTESVSLAEHLAADVTTEHWLPYELEGLFITEQG